MRPDSNRLMLWLLWITATTLSMALLFGLALLLAMRGGMFLFLFAFLLVCWILGGLIVGQAQAVVLQVVGWPMRHWRRSTGIGWIVGFGLGVVANALVSNYGRWGGGPFVPESIAIIGGVLGATLATAQWIQYSSQLPGAAWWIVANTIGWGLGGMAAGAISQQGVLIMGALSGLVSGSCTGIVLAWRSPNTDAARRPTRHSS